MIVSANPGRSSVKQILSEVQIFKRVLSPLLAQSNSTGVQLVYSLRLLLCSQIYSGCKCSSGAGLELNLGLNKMARARNAAPSMQRDPAFAEEL